MSISTWNSPSIIKACWRVPGPHSFEYGGRPGWICGLGHAGQWDCGKVAAFIPILNIVLAICRRLWEERFSRAMPAWPLPTTAPILWLQVSLYLSQRMGDKATLLIGKINVLDMSKNDFFFGGWGNNRFMNTVYVAPPSGVVPPVFFGAIASYQIDPSMKLSFWVYDPEDRPLEYWPDDLFSNGVTSYLSSTYAWDIADRLTKLSFTGIYSTRTGTDYSSVADGDQGQFEPSTKKGSYSLGFQFSHLLHQNPTNPEQGWGLVVKGAVADGNPNYVQASIIAGIGGTGLFPGRELDTFGLSYFYYDLSDQLEGSLTDAAERVSFGDEQGIEVFYSYAVTPWFYLTGDLQYIRPPRSTRKDVFIAALRTNIRF